MRNSRRTRLACLALGLTALLASADTAFGQYGPFLTGSGPGNRAMGGVAVANPQTPSSAIFWNPATMSGFDRSEMDFGAELLRINTSISSSYPANAFGNGIPGAALYGNTKSNSTIFPLPNAGLVFRPDDSDLTFGIALNAVAGFGTDYPASANGPKVNPILGARPPAGLGVGPVFSDYQVFQLNPAVSYQLTDRLSVGASPNISLSRLQVNPGLFIAPDDANGDGFATYPAGTDTRTSWGIGFNVGVYYKGDDWAAGLSYKSRQWSEAFRYNTTGETGLPRTSAVNFELPNIISLGFAYTGIERLTLATDLRYLGYSSARGFGDSGFSANGAARGLGFVDTYAIALGGQYKLTDSIALLAGYSYSTNPVPDSQSGINIASPTIFQHLASLGMKLDITDSLSLTMAYVRGFENSVEGPFTTALGTIPGTKVGNTVSSHSLAVGANVKFGASKSACCSGGGITGGGGSVSGSSSSSGSGGSNPDIVIRKPDAE